MGQSGEAHGCLPAAQALAVQKYSGMIGLLERIFHFIKEWREEQHNDRKKLIMVVLLIGALYGASDETHQLFVPGRSCDIADWIADCVGISFSLLFINIFDKLTFRIMTRLENKV